MERLVGTVVRGLRAPIIRAGDDIVSVIGDTVTQFLDRENVAVGARDVVAVTESVVARAQNNYASVDAIARDIDRVFGAGGQGNRSLGVVFPILSRNRFAILLRAIAMSRFSEIILQLSYPADEVGNHLVSTDDLDSRGVDPWSDALDEARFQELFGSVRHPFTGIDYVAYYKELVQEQGKTCRVLFANRPETILDYCDTVLTCDIHTRHRTRRRLEDRGVRICRGLDQILNAPVDGSGYNPEYGLLGSNKASESKVKLFPRDCMALVREIQQDLLLRTGRLMEVLVYGDGAFKDPVGQIWELADPVVSPGYTDGLIGTPNELKLKYLADNQYAGLNGEALRQAIRTAIATKDSNLAGTMESEGTTPRRLTDLLGSLCDLTSGSGDKGTPIIYIQGYFDNFTNG